MLGHEGWHEYLNDCKLQTPSHAGAGGKYNGQDLKNILKHENLEKLRLKIPDDLERVAPEGKERQNRGEIITDYMSALDMLHTMCVAKSVIPYNVWGICHKFRATFKKVYELGVDISATPKVHMCWTHIPEWFMLESTGLHTLYTSDCSNGESAHGAVKRLEQRSNLEIRRNRGSQRECNALETTVANFNWANDVIPTGANEAEAVEVMEDVPVEVTEDAGLVSQASEADQSCSHDVRLITIKLCPLYSNSLGLWY